MLLPSFALLLTPALAVAQAQTAAPTTPPAHDDHTAMHADKPPVPPSHEINVTVNGHITRLTVDDLLALPQTTVHVHNAHNNQEETYSGPLLADVLARAGLASSKDTEPTILHSVVIATATDHYFVVYSGAEVEPSFSKSQVIVALMKSGLPDTAGGNIQIINSDGAKPARWVHGLLDINVLTLAAKFHGPETPATEAAPKPPTQ
jgi:hypothetical protein